MRMETNRLFKTYKEITDEQILFNDEYYLSVSLADVSSIDTVSREALFNHLFAFDSADIELEIDVSEEEEGKWYLQLLVPHVLTLPEAAKRRLEKGKEELLAHLKQLEISPELQFLSGEDIFTYVQRYNPDVRLIS